MQKSFTSLQVMEGSKKSLSHRISSSLPMASAAEKMLYVVSAYLEIEFRNPFVLEGCLSSASMILQIIRFASSTISAPQIEGRVMGLDN